jgi:SAM-dependent methyltransferase
MGSPPGSDYDHPMESAYQAEFYDHIYHWKDTPTECGAIRELLATHDIGPGSRLLDAACGTGRHLALLRNCFDVSGFDISPAMLSRAAERVPGAHLFQANLASFSVSQPFDAVICLFSAIGHVHGIGNLQASLDCFARATRPGGVFILEPWLEPDRFRAGQPHVQTYQDDELAIARVAVTTRVGDIAHLNLHWTVSRRGADTVEQFVERLQLWLCPLEMMLDACDAAGFDVRFEPEGFSPDRGLLIGRRR